MLKNPLSVSVRIFATFVSVAALGFVAGCSTPEPGAEFNDPYEPANRAVHDFNVRVDQAVFGGGDVPTRRYMPRRVAKSFSNAAYNLAMPSAVLNNILQFNIKGATTDTFRFALNSTFGIAGLFDPAGAIGLYAEDANFGETLHVWGAPEGAYIVLPFAGPTTERDLAGALVDLFIDPLGLVFEGKDYVAAEVVKLTGQVGDRQVYSEMIESILYGSADSYAQMRLSYLQYRRDQIGIKEDVIDPYEEFYAP